MATLTAPAYNFNAPKFNAIPAENAVSGGSHATPLKSGHPPTGVALQVERFSKTAETPSLGGSRHDWGVSKKEVKNPQFQIIENIQTGVLTGRIYIPASRAATNSYKAWKQSVQVTSEKRYGDGSERF